MTDVIVQSRVGEKHFDNCELNKVWRQLQAATSQFEAFENRLQHIVEVYNQEVLPQEKALLLEPCIQLIDHLIPFLGNNDLDTQQKSSLLTWIGALIGNLSRLSDEHACQFRKEVMYILETDRVIQPFQSTFVNATTDVSKKTDKVSELPQGAVGTENTTGWVQSLFRKTAKALHPDRRSQTLDQEAQALLMSELLVARQKGDITKILQFYVEHATGAPQLSQHEAKQLTSTLRQRVKDIIHQQELLVYQTPEGALAYDRLFSENEKQLELKVQQIHQEFRTMRESLQYCYSRIRCAASLEEFLH